MILVSPQLGGSETSKWAILYGKQLFSQISCLGGSETSKLAILDGKQLLYQIRR